MSTPDYAIESWEPGENRWIWEGVTVETRAEAYKRLREFEVAWPEREFRAREVS